MAYIRRRPTAALGGFASLLYACTPEAPEADGPAESMGDTTSTETTDPSDSETTDAGSDTIHDCTSISDTGNHIGDFVSDFMLLDQFGESVSLYSYCNSVVYLISGAVW